MHAYQIGLPNWAAVVLGGFTVEALADLREVAICIRRVSTECRVGMAEMTEHKFSETR